MNTPFNTRLTTAQANAKIRAASQAVTAAIHRMDATRGTPAFSEAVHDYRVAQGQLEEARWDALGAVEIGSR